MNSQIDIGKSFEELEKEIQELTERLKVAEFKQKEHLLERNNEVFYDKTHADLEKDLRGDKKWREYEPYLLRWLKRKGLDSGFHLVPTLFVSCKRNDLKDMTEVIYLYCQNVEVRDILGFGPRPFPSYVAVRTHVIWSIKQIKFERGEYYVRKVPAGKEENEQLEVTSPETKIVQHAEKGFFYHRFPDGKIHVFFHGDDDRIVSYTGPARSRVVPPKPSFHVDLTRVNSRESPPQPSLVLNRVEGIEPPAVARPVKTIGGSSAK